MLAEIVILLAGRRKPESIWRTKRIIGSTATSVFLDHGILENFIITYFLQYEVKPNGCRRRHSAMVTCVLNLSKQTTHNMGIYPCRTRYSWTMLA